MLEVISNIEKTAIKNFDREKLSSIIKEMGFPNFRADQLYHEIYANRRQSFAEMTTLPKEMKDKLEEQYTLSVFKSYKKQVSKDGSVKFLFTLKDGKAIESVFMPWIDEEKDVAIRTTLCISSQVGCAVDCQFCATGKLGFMRNLEVGEIIEQILLTEAVLGEKLTNIVFMGMGEPLLNFNNMVSAIKILTDSKATIVNAKRITVSTSGIAPKMHRLAEMNLGVKLALSLHATTNGVREKIVPWNKKANISTILDEVEYYYRKTKLPVTYEYIPFDGLNDTEEDAKRLAKFAKRVPSRINIIPFNDISFTNPQGFATKLVPTPKARIIQFAEEIRAYGGVAIIRDTFGSDIDAACGQLALSESSYK